MTVVKTPGTTLWPAGGGFDDDDDDDDDDDECVLGEGREAGLRKRRVNPKKTLMLKRVINWVRLIILLERKVRYEVRKRLCVI